MSISLLIVAAPGSAQVQPALSLGERVRVSRVCYWKSTGARVHKVCPTYKGVLAAVTTDSVLLDTDHRGNRLAISRISVQRLDVSRGRRPNPREGARVGAIAGVIGGVIMGVAACSAFESSSGDYALGCAVSGGFGLGALGAGLGALIGLVAPREYWEDVPLEQLRASLTPQSDGRFRLGLSVAF